MTISEMHISFNVQLKAQGGHEDFLPEEVDIFINRASRMFIEEKKAQIRVSDLALNDVRTLLKSSLITGGSLTSHPQLDSVGQAPLPADFEYAVSGRAQITEETAWKILKLLSYEEFLDQVSGEGHSPVFRRLPSTVENTDLLVLSDDTDGAVTGVHLVYLKEAEQVNYSGSVDSELPSHTHQEIISRAVMLALQAIGVTEA